MIEPVNNEQGISESEMRWRTLAEGLVVKTGYLLMNL